MARLFRQRNINYHSSLNTFATYFDNEFRAGKKIKARLNFLGYLSLKHYFGSGSNRVILVFAVVNLLIRRQKKNPRFSHDRKIHILS